MQNSLWDGETMADDSKTYFLGLICMYLIIASALISYTIVNVGNLDGTQELDIFNSIPTLENADFREEKYQNISHIDYTNTWEFSDTKGLYSTVTGDNKVYFPGMNKDGNEYETTYTFLNPESNYVELVIRDYSMLYKSYVVLYPDYIEIWDKNSVYAPMSLFLPIATYPVSYNQSAFNATTYFDTESGLTLVSIDGKQICEKTLTTSDNVDLYAGVYTNDVDTCIIGLSSNIETVDLREGNWGFFEFLTVMVSLIAYTVDDEYLPWWLNAVFIKVPILLLIYIIVCLARGS